MLANKSLGLSRTSISRASIIQPSILVVTRPTTPWPQTTISFPRYTTTTSKPSTPPSLLDQQRLRRPVSPHITIYKWEYQSLTSILQRFSGSFLSGSLYLFFGGYLLAPLILETSAFDVSSITATLAGVPVVVKTAVKFVVAWPFTYHFFNGVKHLLWDNVLALGSKRAIRNCARVVAGCSFVGAVVLAAL